MKNNKYSSGNSFDKDDSKSDSFLPVDSIGVNSSLEESTPENSENFSSVNEFSAGGEERPFVIINGKRYLLAPEEETVIAPEKLENSENFLNLPSPPRTLSFLMKTFLVLQNGPVPFFGWGFMTFGLIFPIVIILTKENLNHSFSGIIIFAASFFIPLAGLFLVCRTWFCGRKIIKLLINGRAGKGVPVRVEDSGVRINDQPIQKITYYFVDHNNIKRKAFAKGLDVSRLTDEESELVLYDEYNPETSFVFDELHGIINIIHQKGFAISPWQYLRLLPMLFFILVFAGELLILFSVLFTGKIFFM